jgi:transposase
MRRNLRDPIEVQGRRQVSNYLGLCPGEHSFGQRQQRGSITKTGNARLRRALIQAAWRLVRFQPDYRLCKKWGTAMRSTAIAAGAVTNQPTKPLVRIIVSSSKRTLREIFTV